MKYDIIIVAKIIFIFIQFKFVSEPKKLFFGMISNLSILSNLT